MFPNIADLIVCVPANIAAVVLLCRKILVFDLQCHSQGFGERRCLAQFVQR